MEVRRISTFKHESGEFAVLSLYFSSRNNVGKLVYTLLKYKIYFVEELQANLLFGNNILSPKHIVIDIGRKSALIRSCGVTIIVNAK